MGKKLSKQAKAKSPKDGSNAEFDKSISRFGVKDGEK